MKVWDLIKPIWYWLVAALLLVSAYSFYVHESRMASDSYNESQRILGVLNEKQKEVDATKKSAEASDLRAAQMAEAAEKANQNVVLEHAKSEALRKKLAALSPVVGTLPSIPSDDPIILRDQIIEQQGVEIASLNSENGILKEEVSQLTVSRDAWKKSAGLSEEAFRLSEQRVRATEIQRDALKSLGRMDKLKWGAIGFGVGFVAGGYK